MKVLSVALLFVLVDLRAQDPLMALRQAAVETFAEGRTVEVVSEQGRPVAGALVGAFSIGEQDAEGPQRASQQALTVAYPGDRARLLAVLLLQHGRLVATDETGRATVPQDARWLVTWHDEQLGEALVAPGERAPEHRGPESRSPAHRAPERPVRLRLLRPTALFVLAVDAAGEPVEGVNLSVDGWTRGTTDRRGEAVLDLRSSLRQPGQDLQVCAELGCHPPPSVSVRRDELPRLPVRLPLPATGQVRVLVYGDDEQPRNDVRSVELRTSPEQVGIAMRGQRDASGATFRTALGLAFEATAQVAGIAGHLQATGAGPTQPGELVVLDVRGTMGPPVLSMRVLGLDGQPVCGEMLGYVLSCAAWHRGAVVTSDDEGRVRIALPTPLPEGTELIVLRRGEADESAYLGAARRPIAAGLRSGENAMPDLQLVTEPIVLAGQVVDENGKPMAGVELRCAPGWMRPHGGLGGGSGRQFFHHVVRSDADGHFEVRDLVRPETVQFAAVIRGYELDGKHDFVTGTRDARLVMRRQGRVRFVLEGVPEMPHDVLVVYFVAPGEEPEDGIDLRGDRWVQKAAGRYEVVLRLHRNGPDLVRLPDVVVEPGVDRELPIAWQQFATLVKVTVVEPDGRPGAGRIVWNRVRKERGGYSADGVRTDPNGECSLLVPKDGGWLAIEEFGMRAVVLEGVTGDQRIVLQPQLTLHVELRGDRELPAGAKVQFQLEHQGRPGPLQASSRGHVEARGAGLVGMVDEPGTYEVRMQVWERIADNRFQRRTVLWGTVDVTDQPGPQSFALELSADQRRVFDELRERLKR
ncbi:MAG TPA: hypothetical protein VFZ65_22530 [Planctomycetota bacterium]|nr:hypothetical protein [Planctomycetota bacterium]